ncbi:cell division protein SepF [Nocardioides sp. C4-1]|uniref:cell division protein SepF n=1 Tax=Nocardioides sp. C4-1 TaxID=3151851 RepID=UPI0032657D14
MSGAMRRIGEYLGLLEDTGRYDDYDQYDERDDRDVRETEPVQAATRPRRVERDETETRPAPVADLAERRRAVGPTPLQEAPAVAELSRITTLHPRTYNEARVVGENFREGTPVIMNLTEMDDNDAKRLVDFAAGLVFATRGTIERITNKVFLLSPPNVSVAAEDKQRIAESGAFFNQS